MSLTTIIALVGINNLSHSATTQVESGLRAANREYLQNYIRANVNRTNLLLAKEISDSQMLTAYAQMLEDNKDSFGPLLNSDQLPSLLRDALKFNPKTGTYQTDSSDPAVVTVFPSQTQADGGQLTPKLENTIRQTALLDLLFPLIKKYNPQKNRIVYIGPSDEVYRRAVPWTDYATSFAQAFPQNYRTQSLLDYEPRVSLRRNWESWGSDPAAKAKLATEVTLTQPFVDAFIQQPIVLFSSPVWDPNRTHVRGEVVFDWTITQVTDLVRGLHIANSGFAFLTQADGNVLAINPENEGLLGLHSQTRVTSTGLNIVERNLSQSNVPTLTNLRMPVDDNTTFSEVQINDQPYQLVLQRLAPLNFLSADGSKIQQSSWTLGFVVPKQELLAALDKTQHAIDDNAAGILQFQLAATFVALLLVVVMVYLLSQRMTISLHALSVAVGKMRQKDYDVQVRVTTKDEFGEVGLAFNEMALAISHYTHHLETEVEKRTLQLRDANHQVVELNELLKSENTRLKAEVEVTRKLQEMILPREQELRLVQGLDIAGYMQPADEVGGDYYDVLQEDGRVKIGIGDVTGHGLESGVLMLMVQTAVRTLLASNETNPTRFLNILNRAIYDNVQRMHSDKNLSLALLDYHKGKVLLSGQHEETIVVRSNGELELIDTINLGFPIGLAEDISAFVGEKELDLAQGDLIVLYTDGITEAENTAGEQYGLVRLSVAVQINRGYTATEIEQAVITDLRDFIGSQRVYDDITLLVLKQE